MIQNNAINTSLGQGSLLAGAGVSSDKQNFFLKKPEEFDIPNINLEFNNIMPVYSKFRWTA